MDIPKVYVDTNIFKFSATELPRLTPRVQKIDGEALNKMSLSMT